MAVAFVLDSGLDDIEAHLRDLLDRGGRVRLLTGDYLDVTTPDALRRLLNVAAVAGDAFDLRVYETARTSFHPKAFVFHLPGGEAIAYVGSSNLTGPALRTGVEWNYRVVHSRDRAGLRSITDGFDRLFGERSTVPVTHAWVDAYERRRVPPPRHRPVEVAADPPQAPPTPHPVQQEALEALEQTRAEGNTAGLVVLATGLGKTWLAAFDTRRAGAGKVLFIAHREEILQQAMRTFRRIRPGAHLGLFTGAEKDGDAEVVFASIQTLSRQAHLDRFAPDEYDYVIVDEFHHAAARTYRRVLDHFDPGFLLGLTATPERTDGGDLLALCGENLVYRADLLAGINRRLLAPFRYRGIADDVDYTAIPWRSNRFVPEVLEQALATKKRALHALEQYETHAGRRTLAFCVSRLHADVMARWFADAGYRAVAVHSGETSAPRATSLQQLADGELDVLFAVDMFNEGVNVPDIDTVMMLRPTESRILWLQQLGRGLRRTATKQALTVLDFIGNHRVFLTKVQALFQLPDGDVHVRTALADYEAGQLELPDGCEVTYDVAAVDILRSLMRTSGTDELRRWYEDFRLRTGRRPTALEAVQEGFNPRAARRGHGSWFHLVGDLGDLTAEERAVLADDDLAAFVSSLETTPMTKSYKMVVLLAMLQAGQFPGALPLAELTGQVQRRARRTPGVRADFSVDLDDAAAVRDLLVKNPINAWVGGRGTDRAYFTFAEQVLRTDMRVQDELAETFQEMVREMAEWRLADYLLRKAPADGDGAIRATVSHAGGRPILFLDRDRYPDTPRGWTPVVADGEEYEANFVKVALNVMRRPGEKENVLGDVLRRWFGEQAGRPGRTQQVQFERGEDGWILTPARSTGSAGAETDAST